MYAVETVRHPDAPFVSDVTEFVERVGAATGGRPISDHLWLDLQSGGAHGFLAVRIADERSTVAYAQISGANDSSSLEVVADPSLDALRGRRLHADAATTAIDAFRRSGGGPLFWWLDDPDEELLGMAATAGLTPVRSLHEMRRTLPAEHRAQVATRAFRPGEDDAEWIKVNNRAFAGHGEQGGWTMDTLELRQAESWFDPDGFRIHERDGRIAAFCWTKLHHETDPVIGEIYVIAVDPDFHGQGLGKELTLAGLDSITERNVSEANLYVDADNVAAIGLYDRLGFSIHRTRRACHGDLAPIVEGAEPPTDPETT